MTRQQYIQRLKLIKSRHRHMVLGEQKHKGWPIPPERKILDDSYDYIWRLIDYIAIVKKREQLPMVQHDIHENEVRRRDMRMRGAFGMLDANGRHNIKSMKRKKTRPSKYSYQYAIRKNTLIAV